jgi:hypothetical protein
VAALNAIGSLWVLLLVVLICSDSFGRSLFDHPIDGVNELVAASMAVIVFCSLRTPSGSASSPAPTPSCRGSRRATPRRRRWSSSGSTC